MRSISSLESMNTLRDKLGESRARKLFDTRRAWCDMENGAYLVVFHYCDVHKPNRPLERVCIRCAGEAIDYFMDAPRCIQAARGVDEALDSYSQLGDFLAALTMEDIYELESVEDRVTALEDRLLTSVSVGKDSTHQIIALRRELQRLRRYYEQLAEIAGELAENRESLFGPEAQKRFAFFLKRTERLLTAVRELRDYITQVREAYQAQIDIEQNQIMKVFTVITAVFLPLTLIVGWYGMNFTMPEYGWSHGYLYVIALSIVVCGICWLLFKRKKWF